MDEFYTNPSNKYKTMYIVQLSKQQQNMIRNALIRQGIVKDDLKRAMNGRVCDLESTIPIHVVLNQCRHNNVR